MPTLEFILQVLILGIVGGIVYSVWKAAKTYGGLIGLGLRIISGGVLILAVETLVRILELFGFDIFERSLGARGEDFFFLVVKAVGLFIMAVGFQRMANILGSQPQKGPTGK